LSTNFLRRRKKSMRMRWEQTGLEGGGFDDAAAAVLEKSMRPCEGLFRNLIFATSASAEP
jgi:hypothetical protein